MMIGLRAVHLVVGVCAFYVFGRTGLFMDRTLDHLAGMPDGPRALYRSAHIYLLFSALLNLTLGFYASSAGTRAGRLAQYVGSGLLLLALYSFISGFYVETPPGDVERPNVRRGIYLSLTGVLLHGAGVLLPWSEAKLHAFRE